MDSFDLYSLTMKSRPLLALQHFIENKLVFRYPEEDSAGAASSSGSDRSDDDDIIGRRLQAEIQAGTGRSQDIKDFLIIMSVCHTVIPEKSGTGGEMAFNASSPDERALVEGAWRLGYRFLARASDSVTIGLPDGSTEVYLILNVIEFTSSRKRMSVVVRKRTMSPGSSGEIKLYSKGADSVMLESLAPDQRQYVDTTIRHLEGFASLGFRTLCFATRVIPEDEYTKWSADFHKASVAVVDRDSKLERVAGLMERDLRLIGASAIEDKLQDGVPETIEQLLEAHIHVWMLTGDKQETAIDIGRSCRLIRPGDLLVINTSSLDETRTKVNEGLLALRQRNTLRSR